jgi:hypothetical protein
LEPLFGGGNILMKSLSLLTAHCPEILWEEVPVTVEEMYGSRHITLHSFVEMYMVSQPNDSFLSYEFQKNW